MLIFSGSPIMAKGMPQSATSVLLSASLDPFGVSAYLLQTSKWTVVQRNTASIPLAGILLLNRLGVLSISFLSLVFTFKAFNFSLDKKSSRRNLLKHAETNNDSSSTVLSSVKPATGWQRHWAALLSFTKIDLKFITRSIPFILTCIGLLFYLSMEIYGAIEKGIRLPQKYATSGLMAKAIIENFHGLCLIAILYYANEIVWRSRNSNFYLIENATPASSTALFFSKWTTLSIIIIFFTTLMILLGIVFQIQYYYPVFDWSAYAGVYLFTSLPLIISAGIVLCIQKIIKYRYVGLVVSAAIILFTATSMGKQLLPYPLLNFQIPYKGLYSDMNGFGLYQQSFSWLHLFGLCVVVMLAILITQLKKFRIKLVSLFSLALLGVCASWAAVKLMNGYQPKNKEAAIVMQAEYEKKYRHFQNQPQPTVTDVKTTIDLFPDKNKYTIAANYIIQNKSTIPIDSILINFDDDITINETSITKSNKTYLIRNQYTVIHLQNPLLPGDTAQFATKFTYKWSAVNGHQALNAIVQNGSFMRISRYYPKFGYLSENEIESEEERIRFSLGKATTLVSVYALKNSTDDFINLDMVVSTNSKQTAIGIGELETQWSKGDRNYFHYKTLSLVPFRFAVSSAEYAVKKTSYMGKSIEIYYHPQHHQNVDHLLKNVQLTLEYCERNFGAYPFKTIRFAEVSAFTNGFAATAYPTTIYMTEDMIFHCNINADKQQDVINELAGHELSHLWWGNSQIYPEEREGATMLTETLAMYTEMMLLKQMYGKEKVDQKIKMHMDIFESQKGFSTNVPLIQVTGDKPHISYSKGAVVMYHLSELIGEKKVNIALMNFLEKNKYPNPKPISTDFLAEVYSISDKRYHDQIKKLFYSQDIFKK